MTTPEVGKTLLIQLESWASFVGKGMSMSAEVEGARVVWAETAPATARRTRVDFMLAVETSLI
jgi:S-adenosylhomocysteine hydrolase